MTIRWSRLPMLARVFIVALGIIILAAFSPRILRQYFSRSVSYCILVFFLLMWLLFLSLARRWRYSIKTRQQIQREDKISLTSIIWLSIMWMAVGTCLFAYACFSSGGGNSTSEIFVRVALGLIAILCFLVLLTGVVQLLTARARMRKHRKLFLAARAQIRKLYK